MAFSAVETHRPFGLGEFFMKSFVQLPSLCVKNSLKRLLRHAVFTLTSQCWEELLKEKFSEKIHLSIENDLLD